MSLFSSLKSLIKGKNKPVVGIDIGSSLIKIVVAYAEKGANVFQLCAALDIAQMSNLDLEPGKPTNLDPPAIGKILSTMLKEYNLTGLPAEFSIPREHFIMKLIELPPMPDEKITRGMIDLQVSRNIAIPVNDVGIEYHILPDMLFKPQNKSIFEEDAVSVPLEDRKRSVLLLATRRHYVDKLREIAHHAQITQFRAKGDAMHIIRSCNVTGKLPYIVVDIGTSGTGIYSVYQSTPIREHSTSVGGQHITEAIAQALGIPFVDAEQKKRDLGFTIPDAGVREAMLLQTDEIFSDLSDIMLNFEHQFQTPVTRVFLAGGGAAMKGVLEEAKKKVNVEVSIANPLGNFRREVITSQAVHQDVDSSERSRKDSTLTTSHTDPEDAMFTIAAGAALNLLKDMQ